MTPVEINLFSECLLYSTVILRQIFFASCKNYLKFLGILKNKTGIPVEKSLLASHAHEKYIQKSVSLPSFTLLIYTFEYNLIHMNEIICTKKNLTHIRYLYISNKCKIFFFCLFIFSVVRS